NFRELYRRRILLPNLLFKRDLWFALKNKVFHLPVTHDKRMMLDHIHIHMYNSPIIATAIHDGHYIPITYLKNMILEEHERTREEDPYTIYLTELPANRVTVSVSRFFTDLNRPKNKCIYRTPEDAWNLHVWKAVSKTMEKQSLDYYDQ